MEIKVRAGSSKNKVEKIGDEYIVYVKARAVKGEANKAVLKLLRKYFGKEVRIVKGLKSKVKTISLLIHL